MKHQISHPPKTLLDPLSTKRVREHLCNPVAHLDRILLRSTSPRHAAGSRPGKLNVWQPREHANSRSVAPAVIKNAQIGVVDAAPENKLCRLLPTSANTALIKDDLVDPRHRYNPLPLGRVETTASGRVLETPRDPSGLAKANQAKGKQHELVPKTKTLPIVI